MTKVAYFKGRPIASEPISNIGNFDELVEFSNRIAQEKNLSYNNSGKKLEYYVQIIDEEIEIAI